MQKKITRDTTTFFSRHEGAVLYFACVIFLSLYLLIFQTSFTLSGDTWAEAFPEYVNDVLTKDPSDIIQSSWAGYLTIVPSFLTQAYISAHLPLGNIDYYFRFVTLLFTVLCCAFIAHPFNRRLVKSDALRFFLAFLILFSLCHVSGLAFINIWYLGFTVITLVCISSKQLTPRWELAFTLFSVLICLTKPSLIVTPFILYRLARQLNIHRAPFVKVLSGSHKLASWQDWLRAGWSTSKIGIVSSLVLLVSVVIESYLTVFGANGFKEGSVHSGLPILISDLFLASGTLFLKVLHLPFVNIWAILAASIFVVALFALLYRKTKLLSITMALCLVLGIYLHIYSPDNTLDNVWSNFHELYSDQTKLQRELIPNFMLLLALFINLGYFLRSRLFKERPYLRSVSIVGLAVLFLFIAKPWGTIINSDTAQFYSVDISNYRASLNNGQPACMPIAPTTFLDKKANWFFQYNGGCYHLNNDTDFSTSSFVNKLTENGNEIRLTGGPKNVLKSVMLPIKASDVAPGTRLEIKDSLTGKVFSSAVRNLPSAFQQISFNTAGLEPRDDDYLFTLHATRLTPITDIYTGNFTNGTPLVYGLYIGLPN